METATVNLGWSKDNGGWTTEERSWTLGTVTEEEGPTQSPALPPGNTCGYIQYQVAVYCGLLGFLAAFGIIGNLLSVFAMWPKRNKNATSFILIVLSFLDSVLLVVWFYQLAIPVYCQYHHRCDWFLKFRHPYLSQYGWPIGTIAHLAGALVVVLVTGHRYIAVCHPTRAGRWSSAKMAKIQVAIIIASSAAFCLPRFFDDHVVMTSAGGTLVPSDIKRDVIGYGMVYNVIVYYVVIFVVPCGLLVFLTWNLWRSLEAARIKRAEMTKTKRDEEDMTRTLVVVVVVFIISQLANPIRRLIVELTPAAERGCGSLYYFYSPIASILTCGNCAANFVIYIICSRRFRQTLRRRLPAVFRRGTQVHPTATDAQEGNKTTDARPATTHQFVLDA